MSVVSRQYRIRSEVFDQWRVRQNLAVFASSEDRSKIEAEPVDLHLRDPVTECVQDQFSDHRMVAVERVPAARVIEIPPVIVEHVIDGVVDSAEGECRIVRKSASFGRVVEDHIQEDFDSGTVQLATRVLNSRT